MKIVSLLFCFFLIGCKPSTSQELEMDVKKMFEHLECPAMSQPQSDSN